MPRWGNLPTGPILAVDQVDLDQVNRDVNIRRLGPQYLGLPANTTIGTTAGYLALNPDGNLELFPGGEIVLGATVAGEGVSLRDIGHAYVNRVLGAGLLIAEKDKYVPTLPVWNDDLTRFAGNPVITAANLGGAYQFVADPHLFVVDDVLYCVFEGFENPPSLGRIWIAQSTNGGQTWTGFSQISVAAYHFSHPQVVIHNGRAYVFYNAARNNGEIYCRSKTLFNFPGGAWSAEVLIATNAGMGWTGAFPFIEFAIFEHRGLWYLLAINSAADDKVRGRYSTHFTLNWNAESANISPDGQTPTLLDVANFAWLNSFVEITPLKVGDKLYLYFGGVRASDGTRGIVTFAVTELSPNRFAGYWLVNDHTFPLAAGPSWDDDIIHRASPTLVGANPDLFGISPTLLAGAWIYAYDADDGGAGNNWKIGIATMPAIGVGAAAVPPTGAQGSRAVVGALYGTELRVSGYGGPHAIGGGVLAGALLAIGIGATWAPAAGSGVLVQIEGTLDIPPNQYGLGLVVAPAGILADGVNPIVSSVYLVEPNITLGGATVTRAATVYIKDEPTEGSTANAALMFGSAAKIHGLSSLTFLTEAGDIRLNPASSILLPRETVMDPLNASVVIGGSSNTDIVLNRAISGLTWEVWEIIGTENNILRFWATVTAFRAGVANVYGAVVEHLDALSATVTVVDNANSTYNINFATGATGQRVTWRLTRRSTYTT